MIRILVADDQSLVREGLSSLLQTQSDLEVVGEAENGRVAVEKAIALQPDVILMDIRMPIMYGIAAIRMLKEQKPSIKILVLTTFDEDRYVLQAMSYGARGYLLKDTPSSQLAQAIRSVNQGYTQMGPGLFDKTMGNANIQSSAISPALEKLTAREKEVLQLIATGHNNKEIAAKLYITERTVKNHVNSILRSLDLRDRTQAAIFAYEYFKR